LIPGDGIGPEVTAATVRVLRATGVSFAWETHPAGVAAIGEHGTPLPAATVEAVRRTGVALKGPTETPVASGHRSVNVELRKALDLYANLRPVRTLPGVRSRYDGVDVVVVRENTEDLYSGLEHVVVPGVVESLKIITERASTRIALFAFEHARRVGRKRITAVHKANIMKLSDGLFLDCCRMVARQYPEIRYDERIVDNACMQLVLDPSRFDVLLLENLYGDIVSDLCAGFVGGLGLAPGANLGEEAAVFEAVHGTAPDIAGRNLANPVALVLSAAMMLDHLGEPDAASRVRSAVREVLAEGKTLTHDLGGTAGTTEIAEAIAARVSGERP
jgi:isocitrate dehydrogenase (NAD+)